MLEDLRLDPDLLNKLSLADIQQCMEARFKLRQLGTLKAAIKLFQKENSGYPSTP